MITAALILLPAAGLIQLSVQPAILRQLTILLRLRLVAAAKQLAVIAPTANTGQKFATAAFALM